MQRMHATFYMITARNVSIIRVFQLKCMWEGRKGGLIIECGSHVFFHHASIMSITNMQNY